MLGLICLAAFLFLIDYAARLLRPVSLVKRVGDEGLAVIKSVYPDKLTGAPAVAAPPQDAGPVERTVLHRGNSGIVLAVDLATADRRGGEGQRRDRVCAAGRAISSARLSHCSCSMAARRRSMRRCCAIA